MPGCRYLSSPTGTVNIGTVCMFIVRVTDTLPYRAPVSSIGFTIGFTCRIRRIKRKQEDPGEVYCILTCNISTLCGDNSETSTASQENCSSE